MLASIGFPVVFRYSSNTESDRETGTSRVSHNTKKKQGLQEGRHSGQDGSTDTRSILQEVTGRPHITSRCAVMLRMLQGTVDTAGSNTKIGLLLRWKR